MCVTTTTWTGAAVVTGGARSARTSPDLQTVTRPNNAAATRRMAPVGLLTMLDVKCVPTVDAATPASANTVATQTRPDVRVQLQTELTLALGAIGRRPRRDPECQCGSPSIKCA